MGSIKAFLLPPVMEETEKVIITKRAKGEDGNPVPFVLRRIDEETNDKLRKRATKREKRNGQWVERFAATLFGQLRVQACVVEPDFRATEMCEHYGVVDPLDVPSRMLTSGEYTRLLTEINLFNDFDELAVEEMDETAKNS